MLQLDFILHYVIASNLSQRQLPAAAAAATAATAAAAAATAAAAAAVVAATAAVHDPANSNDTAAIDTTSNIP